MEDEEIVVSATEIIQGRLYFATLRAGYKPKATRNSRYFHIEDSIVYENFYLDFGPYHICHVYQFCRRLEDELACAAPRKLVFYTSDNDTLRLNAACLIGCYQVICLSRSPAEVHAQLTAPGAGWTLLRFRDASGGPPLFYITLLDVLRGLKVALQHNFFDISDFNEEEYLFYETVENGDLNWIIPGKLLAFSGPHARSRLDRGYPLHCPEHYHQYFRTHNVTTIVRLNKKSYEAAQFTAAGFQHKELFFVDGSVPSDQIVDRFIRIVQAAPGAVAVHCKAGLGRTGTLIACYMMQLYGFTAREAIAWLRLCRPGSVIGHQQCFLEECERRLLALWRLGKADIPVHTHGIYSRRAHADKRAAVSLHSILDNGNSNVKADEAAAGDALRAESIANGNAVALRGSRGTRVQAVGVRHYMLPTSSAVVRARAALSNRKSPGRAGSLPRAKPGKAAAVAAAEADALCASETDAGGVRGRRKRDKSPSPPVLPDAADTAITQGDRLYKIKALRSKCAAPAPAAPAAPAPRVTRASGGARK